MAVTIRWLGASATAIITLLLAFAISAGSARATDADEMLADRALEARARAITAGLRCIVCQNQSIDDSSAPLARDLRRLVRERISAGDRDDQVIAYVVAKYGEFALLKPRFAIHTLALWLTPLAVLLAILAYAALRLSRRSTATESEWAAAPLTPDQERRLGELAGADPGDASRPASSSTQERQAS